MNIEKLAKHLKEFTLDEIEMIAECDCKTELEKLLNGGKLVFEQGLYKYAEPTGIIDYAIFPTEPLKNSPLNFETAVKYFLENYAKNACTKRTYETYESIFRIHILPFFRSKFIQEITIEDVKAFYINCKKRNLGHRRLKNTLTQLNQLLKYYKMQGTILECCNFQVRRLTNKNKFSINRIIFEGDLCQK